MFLFIIDMTCSPQENHPVLQLNCQQCLIGILEAKVLKTLEARIFSGLFSAIAQIAVPFQVSSPQLNSRFILLKLFAEFYTQLILTIDHFFQCDAQLDTKRYSWGITKFASDHPLLAVPLMPRPLFKATRPLFTTAGIR